MTHFITSFWKAPLIIFYFWRYNKNLYSCQIFRRPWRIGACLQIFIVRTVGKFTNVVYRPSHLFYTNIHWYLSGETVLDKETVIQEIQRVMLGADWLMTYEVAGLRFITGTRAFVFEELFRDSETFKLGILCKFWTWTLIVVDDGFMHGVSFVTSAPSLLSKMLIFLALIQVLALSVFVVTQTHDEENEGNCSH